jgi:hypothetical protein
VTTTAGVVTLRAMSHAPKKASPASLSPPPGASRSLLARLVPRPRPVSRKRRAIALAVAGVADLVQIVFLPAFIEGVASPFDDALDLVVVVALLAILGFSYRLVFALALELVPGAALFPTWTAVVLSLPAAPKEPEPTVASLPPR